MAREARFGVKAFKSAICLELGTVVGWAIFDGTVRTLPLAAAFGLGILLQAFVGSRES